ncbi:Quinol monooxygenase YgiN [Chitinophaga costaii]|uniref:Quinol monooxygenase YgiN n=1 Tax=Chitinophaga costaii TaxID=1335309 RepID=A0A1C4EL56_9BACT|nr:antibiotic biosynthesis monooxygenase [Chitinophaga costaii]PUZ22424.1 antibiotic biosynthesis monooxygenase [Chitinophaga costaii]SCC44359.1 Quinol monooxygenase YgiN [Chitinophaga costaii]
MITKALLARLEAKPGKEQEVETFLKGALPLVQDEKGTIHWFAIKFGTSTFGIFDTFSGEEGQQAHLSGAVAKALMDQAPNLFSTPPDIALLDVFAVK